MTRNLSTESTGTGLIMTMMVIFIMSRKVAMRKVMGLSET